ncbi:hypothetical protein PV755_09590 [Streptomyces caniscabiei]|uniref:Uncharacterized protein n=1 Tax=Streptomyces caniscabiei TaxID=2746961 RepID=A0A927KY53_9ACTN|nr:hypothetical protein [Streptomyces caniscabiei]MBD9721982.1 hypothetical protein [Streptomyces caniscabiei]MDX3509174.1 hypothetical protein [Streptomyces caniscabiei]MDX3717073.1 hypothetical protein [Streptomyces caniscabiei]WEO22941.1 hypothetical protein IHE65_07135 [Streptomyces caniscabiei]
MSTAGSMHVQCPECDALVPIGLTLKPATREGDTVIVTVEPDLTDTTVHAWTHEAGNPTN